MPPVSMPRFLGVSLWPRVEIGPHRQAPDARHHRGYPRLLAASAP